MTSPTPRTLWIEALRVLSAVAVVTLHCAVTISLQGGEHPGWPAAAALEATCRFCVPMFVMITGYVLSLPQQAKRFSPARSIRRIAPALIFWTFFYSFVPQLVSGISDLREPFWRLHYLPLPSLSEKLYLIALGRPYYHLWYLYMLLGLYLLIPFILELQENIGEKKYFNLTLFIFIAAFLQSCLLHFSDIKSSHLIGPLHAIPLLGYFIIGNSPALRSHFAWTGSIRIFLLASLITFSTTALLLNKLCPNSSRILHSWTSPTVLISTTAIFALMPKFFNERALPEWQELIIRQNAKISFRVYLIHPFILSQLISYEITADIVPTFIGTPLLSLIVYLISAGTTLSFRHIPILRSVV